MVEIFAIKLADYKILEQHKSKLLDLLPPASQKFVLRHKTQSGLYSSLLGEVMVRKILSTRINLPSQEITFQKTVKGKPFLEDESTYFNLTHSGEWVILGVSDKDIGVDIELIREVNYRVAERFFSPKEYNLLKKQSGKEKEKLFFDFWTLKESYLKLLGTGLTKSLGSFTIIKENEEFRLVERSKKLKEAVFFKQYHIAEDYIVSVCSYGNSFTNSPIILELKDLL